MRRKEKNTQKEKKQEKEKKEKISKRQPKQKKPHDDGYVMKKNMSMKILRVLLWGILIFVFIRGIVTIFKPNKEEEVTRLIKEFKEDYNDFSNKNNEVMAFAQNFAKEYLTYDIKGEEDYKNRITPYVSTNFMNENIYDFKNSASTVYVQAYRVEEYSENQMDVYVLAEIEYYLRSLNEDGQSYSTESRRNQMILNIPVYVSPDQTYVVENIPLMVSDSVYLEKYNVQEYVGTSLEDSKATVVKTAVENFLRAYFEQDESVINYYLDTSAERSQFTSLMGRFTFLGIDELKCYQEEGGDIICLVEFKIQDSDNNSKILQKINLFVKESGGKYYIKSMGTRIGNLKMN